MGRMTSFIQSKGLVQARSRREVPSHAPDPGRVNDISAEAKDTITARAGKPTKRDRKAVARKADNKLPRQKKVGTPPMAPEYQG